MKIPEYMNEKQLKFIMTCNEWNPPTRTPDARLPIMAIVRIGSGWNDDMDIDDDGMEESIKCDLGDTVPVCGVSYDGGSGTVITPDCVKAADASGLTFIDWNRVEKWRYLNYDESGAHWDALIDEARELENHE